MADSNRVAYVMVGKAVASCTEGGNIGEKIVVADENAVAVDDNMLVVDDGVVALPDRHKRSLGFDYAEDPVT